MSESASQTPAGQFRRQLKSGPVLGPFSKTSDPAMVETIGHAGMDFIILDLEHGPNDIVNLGELIRAAQVSGMAPVVRVGSYDQIGRALDLGAVAVQIPHVNSAAQAREIVDAARFAPDGHRGVCRYVRAAAYGVTEKQRYFREANEAVVIAQVEGIEGLGNLAEILGVPGIDVIFVGVYDLSQSLGVTGQVDHPDVEAALRDVVTQCREKAIPVGTFVETPETTRKYRDMGINYLCYSVDVGLLADAVKGVVETVRGRGD